ncbi:hypothetical protein KUTeg_017281 [Tegillarca granosa]|uniref:Coronin n=1 Tax=Tegillarca granosa TaxID=220873 RepID=A0ABQ9EIR9_TEGGR|nr:hypothetical protein KUTeg_017281 [Tegillarca granosa]
MVELPGCTLNVKIYFNFVNGVQVKVMAFKFRTSKYRHVYGSPNRREQCYENVRITRNTHDGQCCAVNPKFLAVTGRVDITAPSVCGHAGPVLDIKWSPFNDNIIASSSEDNSVKVWKIPDNGLRTNLTEWQVDLHGHQRRVGYVEWHPTAENVVLSAGLDYKCILWNVEQAEPINVISCHDNTVFSISWNLDGSLFTTACKDKKIREGEGHQSNRRKMGKPVCMETIDSSSGLLYPYYDHDTNMVYVAGKGDGRIHLSRFSGDGSIRYYEVTDGASSCFYLNCFQSPFPQRGFGVMPKRGCDPNKCEVMKFYKVHASKNLLAVSNSVKKNHVNQLAISYSVKKHVNQLAVSNIVKKHVNQLAVSNSIKKNHVNQLAISYSVKKHVNQLAVINSVKKHVNQLAVSNSIKNHVNQLAVSNSIKNHVNQLAISYSVKKYVNQLAVSNSVKKHVNQLAVINSVKKHVNQLAVINSVKNHVNQLAVSNSVKKHVNQFAVINSVKKHVNQLAVSNSIKNHVNQLAISYSVKKHVNQLAVSNSIKKNHVNQLAISYSVKKHVNQLAVSNSVKKHVNQLAVINIVKNHVNQLAVSNSVKKNHVNQLAISNSVKKHVNQLADSTLAQAPTITTYKAVSRPGMPARLNTMETGPIQSDMTNNNNTRKEPASLRNIKCLSTNDEYLTIKSDWIKGTAFILLVLFPNFEFRFILYILNLDSLNKLGEGLFFTFDFSPGKRFLIGHFKNVMAN